MNIHETRHAMRTRIATGALLVSGAMLFIGPASVAVADPSVDKVTNSTSSEDNLHSGPFSLAQSRSVVRPLRLDLSSLDETSSLRLQMKMDRLSKYLSTLSNIMKKESDTDGSIVGNIK